MALVKPEGQRMPELGKVGHEPKSSGSGNLSSSSPGSHKNRLVLDPSWPNRMENICLARPMADHQPPERLSLIGLSLTGTFQLNPDE